MPALSLAARTLASPRAIRPRMVSMQAAPPSNPYRREPIGGWRVSDFLSSRRARLDVAVDPESRAEVALASQAKRALRHGRTWRRCVPALIARHWDLGGEPLRGPDLAQLGARKPPEAGNAA